ncbi:HK97-gp10 family putative phage morphogenesis protein [Niallia sp. 03091]|uniref:HK97-gp10 family putative phage morphogenesis protein n=1 Tax=Niallia sp. 03091 TaxID=3458059 RepID=UPI004044601C
MSVDIDMSGLDRQLRELAYKTQSGGKKATKVGAAIVAAALKVNAPYENRSDRKWKQQRQFDLQSGVEREFKHLRDDVVISPPNELGNIEIKFGKDTAWRSHFVNDGTIYQAPQHFAEKTTVETHEAVKAAMERVILGEVNGT